MPNRPYTSSAAHSFRPNPTPSSTTATATQILTSTPVLRLRATATPPSQTTRTPRIQWAEDVIDNEGLGRKSSKVCCIYHAPRQVGESSSESSSSSSDDSSSDEHDDSSDNDDGAARMAGNRRAKTKVKGGHDEHGRNEAARVHAEGGGCEGHDHGEKKKEVGERQRSDQKKRRSGNAYERMPKHSKGSGTAVIVERKG